MPSLSHFIASRHAHWTELERLLARGEGNGLRHFDADQIEALGREYRHVISDLAMARRDFPDDQLTESLNSLAARAHLRLYRTPAGSWKRLGRFFWTDFARRFRAARGYLAVAALLLFGPALLGYLAALLDPKLRDALVPEDFRRIMESGRTWTDIEPALRGVVEARGAKPRDIFQPVRVALAGTTVSPGIFETLQVLGRDESLRRIDEALARRDGG